MCKFPILNLEPSLRKNIKTLFRFFERIGGIFFFYIAFLKYAKKHSSASLKTGRVIEVGGSTYKKVKKSTKQSYRTGKTSTSAGKKGRKIYTGPKGGQFYKKKGEDGKMQKVYV